MPDVESSRTLEDWRGLIDAAKARDRNTAIAVCREAVASMPECEPLYRIGAELLVAANLLNEAEAWIEIALRLDPVKATTSVAVRRIRARQGRLGQALQSFDARRSVSEPSSALEAEHGRLLFSIGEYDAAAKRFERAIDLDPRLGRWALALERARRLNGEQLALGLTPERQALLRQGVEMLVQGDAELAQTIFTKLVSVAPRAPASWAGLRGAMEVLGVTDAAGRLLARGHELPDARAAMEQTARRQLSRRGLVFDPRDAHPIGRNQELLRRVDSPQDLQRADNALWVSDPGGQLIEHDPVISLDPTGADKIKVSYRAAPKYVATLSDVALAGRGVLINADRQVLGDFLREGVRGKYYPGSTPTALAFDPGEFLDGACAVRWVDQPAFLMSGHTELSFGDWIWNFPPRLGLAEAAGLDIPLVVSSDIPSHFLEILFALGADPRRILLHDPGAVTVFRRLYAPSWTMTDRRAPASGWADIYGLIGSRRRPGGPPLIYVSRRGAPKRPLVNEAEIEALFASRGFEIVAPEALDFDEILQVFANPICVAGAYGSGLRNVVFCERKPTVFFLMPPYPAIFHEGSAIWLAEMGVRYGWCQGEAEPGHEASHPNRGAWRVPVEAVERKLDLLLAKIGVRAR